MERKVTPIHYIAYKGLLTSDIKSEPQMLRYHKALLRNEKIQDTVEACSLIPLKIRILTFSLFIIVGKTLQAFMNLQSLYEYIQFNIK